MEATTDAPTPNINPMPVENNHNGATIFTAAKASLPMPFPTNIPSVMTNRAENIMPSTVGSNSLRNNAVISTFLKSMLFLSIMNKMSYHILGCKITAFLREADYQMVIIDRKMKKHPAKLTAFLPTHKITIPLNNLARRLSFYWRLLMRLTN